MLAVHFGVRIIPTGFEVLTVGAAAVAPASTSADAAWIQVENGPIRYRIDGGIPTAAVGIPAFDGDSFGLGSYELKNFQAIRQGTVNGTCNITRGRLE